MATLAEILTAKAEVQARKGEMSKVLAHGMVIRAEDEKAKLAATIKETLDATAPKIQPLASQPRELGAMERGERVPMDYPPQNCTEEEQKWFSSLHSFETDLCIVIDPDSQHAWLAVKRSNHDSAPLLLHRFPLLNRPQSGQPF